MRGRALTRRGFNLAATAGASALWLKARLPSFAEPIGSNQASSINPFIGASTSRKFGEGKTFPGAATPFGLVQLSPDTITGGDNTSGYSYEHTTIEGFSFIHMSGVGWFGDFGNLQVMPSNGPMKLASGRIGRPAEGWRSRFDHATEQARANFYAVTLGDYGIRCELTATPRSGLLRFTYRHALDSRIQIDLARRIGGTSTRQYVKVVAANAIEGWMKCPPTGGGWGNGRGKADYTVHFRMEFSRALEKFGVWSVDVPEEKYDHPEKLVSDYFQTDDFYASVKNARVIEGCKEQEGNHLGFYAEFPTHAGEQVLVRAGISFVSAEGARENLVSDCKDWDFDRAVRKGRNLWNTALNNIQVEGGTATQNAIFSTALYHAMIDPRAASDANGNYRAADNSIRKAEGYTRRTIFSGWDVFRAEFPLMTLLRPDIVSDQINSLIALAAESKKGYLERWEILNAYSGCMDGDPAISVIVDAYAKGIRTFDIDKAYAACHQTASGIGAMTNRPDNEFYLQHGYLPNRVSWTLDNCYYDWCMAVFSAALGKDTEAQQYATRAQNYRLIYDPSVRSMRAKDKSGNWIKWEGKTVFGQGCTESNPGQQTWFVPHDVEGLIGLMGKEAFVSTLEEFFEKTPPGFGWNDFYNHGNEPVHHVAYLFTYAGKPWLTQKWVNRILEGAYHNRVDGICGNDDVGQMSAWYVLSAIGLYPVCPGDGIYILGSPIFTKSTIRLDPKYYKGKTFTVVAKNAGPECIYISSATLNGQPLNRAWIRHEEIVAGGVLDLTMAKTPNETWGASKDDLPPSPSAFNRARS